MTNKYTSIPKLTLIEIKRFWTKVERSGVDDCWSWLGCVQSGNRGLVTIRGIVYKAPRIAYYLATHVDPADLCVCHTCDNPNCVNPKHLFTGTNNQNIADKVIKCRQARGQMIGISKLNDKQIAQILLSKKTHRELGLIYGVDHTVLGDIFRGITWKHVLREIC